MDRRSDSQRHTSFPALYHAHHSADDEDLLFWLEMVQQYGNPVLELGCGTGRVLVPLAQAGSQIFGLDADFHMLAYLRSTIPAGLPLQPAIFQADMAAFRFGIRFPLILLPCNTLSSLDDITRQEMYRQVKAHLAPGGIFIASLPNPRSLMAVSQVGKEEVETEFAHPITGFPIIVSSAWQRSRTEFILTWHYDHLLDDGQVERFSMQTRHTLQGRSSYQKELSAAGLKVIQSWGDYDQGAYTVDSPHWIIAVQAG